MWEDDDYDDVSENDPPSRQPLEEEEQAEEKQQPSPITPGEADALRNRVRGELANLRLWLLAHQGWRELHGKLVPREEDRGAGSSGGSSKPLDLRGLYEYMQGHLELFRDFLAFFYEPGSNDMTHAAVQLKFPPPSLQKSAPAAGRSPMTTGAPKSGAAAAMSASTRRFRRPAASQPKPKTAPASASAPTAARKKEAAVATLPPPPPPLPTKKASTKAQVVTTTKQQQQPQQKQQLDRASRSSPPAFDPAKYEADFLSEHTPSSLGLALEEVATNEELQVHFTTVSNAWSQLYRVLNQADRRIGQRQKFFFKYGRTAAEAVFFDTMLAFLKWLLDPRTHPQKKSNKDDVAAEGQGQGEVLEVPDEEVKERRDLILDHLHALGTGPFYKKIVGAMKRKMPPPPPQLVVVEKEELEKEEENEGAEGKEEQDEKVALHLVCHQEAAAAAKSKAVGKVKEKTPAAAHPPPAPARHKTPPSPPLPASVRTRIVAKRKRPTPAAAAAAASASEGAAFAQTCLGSERFFKKQLPGGESRGVIGLEPPMALLNQVRRLDVPTIQEVRSIVCSLVPSHADERKKLEDRYVATFPAWVDDLLAGFNLLLYGVGSKRTILERFAEYLRKEGAVVVVDGLDPRAGKASRLLEVATEMGHGPVTAVDEATAGGWAGVEALWATAAVGGTGAEVEKGSVAGSLSFSSLWGREMSFGGGGGGGGGGGLSLPSNQGKRRQKAAVRSCTLRSAQQQQQGDPDVPLFFVIHSLDCRNMWQHKGGHSMLEALIELVNRPGVHLVTSVDHLNAPLLFSAQHLEAMSWVWHDVTTLAPYVPELAAHSSEKHGGQSYLPAGEGLKYLLQCVTKRHLELLQFLAVRQLEEEVKEANRRVETAAANKRRRKEEATNGVGGRVDGAAGAETASTERGITFEDLAQQCADKMISRSHGNLRQLFDELLDHRLLKSKGMGTKTRYWIPRSTAELKMIVNYREK
ncbi:origin recognition complex subunit 2 [Nannochloropsis oceanica]